ncbi:hypothetical protein [Tenacibaculum discolor]|uniref:hypothetical protein n=1 Tax=Tenacibaculum discolor TaxID=361581 RepID=UPI000EAE0B93|nr:hypothetical protein [Tenacibaculum discolor]RLK03089.1 hypothetical protein C8N27_0937 [Tenacibaculum discolor]
MSAFSEKEKIKAQILDTERMLGLVGDHPLMSENLKNKIKNLKEKLASFSSEIIEPKVRLLFSGNAVKGSLGIKSKFVSKTIKPIQELVKTQTALVRFGIVGERGKAKDSGNSELYLTALPTGSFGVELSQLENNDLFDENDVSIAIKQVVELISASVKSDEMFEKAMENTPKRNLTNLKQFLKEVSEANSILKIETGSFGINISEQEIKEGFERVNLTETDEENLFIKGILRGILLDSGKFEIIGEEGEPITGIINSEIPEELLIDYDKKYLNKECSVHLIIHKTTFITGKEKLNYELVEISDII